MCTMERLQPNKNRASAKISVFITWPLKMNNFKIRKFQPRHTRAVLDSAL